MNCLLDTHTFLWAAISPSKLGKLARSALKDPENTIYVSAITFWEVSLKFSLGKLELGGVTPADLPEVALKMGCELLELSPGEAATFNRLPRIEHKDPFDRMLVWQAISLGMTLITKDADLGEYQSEGLKMLW